MTVTIKQMRDAILEVLSDKIVAPVGVQFDTYDNLMIGVRAALAGRGLREPQIPVAFMADHALDARDAATYQIAFHQLVDEGVITEQKGSTQFGVTLVAEPFSAEWTFLGELGAGGQGVTAKVARRSDHVLGALKIPHVSDRIPAERFKREIDTLQQVDHPAIVKLLDSNLDLTRGELGYVTPLGTPLDEYWNAKAPSLSAKEIYDRAYEIVACIARGLALLHDRKIVHRDLKPDNIVMCDDAPVVIDFGLVFRPGDERLSVLDGRVVANNFATPAAAHYGLEECKPAWDCLGLAWIYGFLIGRGARPRQFHWRYHILVEEVRSNRAKAVLAACSDEETSPPDARAFLALLDNFRLSGEPEQVGEMVSNGIQAAVLAHAEAKAVSAKYEVEKADRAAIGMQIIEPPLTELREALIRHFKLQRDLPFVVNEVPAGPSKRKIEPRLSMKEVLEIVFSRSRAGGQSEVIFFICKCSSGQRFFEVGASIHYSPHHAENGIQFSLNVWCKKPGESPPEWPDVFFELRPNGTIARDSDTVTPDQIAAMAFQWMINPRRWLSLG